MFGLGLLLMLLLLLLLLQSAGFGQRAQTFFWKGPEATLRKKPNAKEDDAKKESRSDQRSAMGKWIAELVGTA